MCEASGGPAWFWERSQAWRTEHAVRHHGAVFLRALFSPVRHVGSAADSMRVCPLRMELLYPDCLLPARDEERSASRLSLTPGPCPQEELLWGCVTTDRHRPQA